MQPGFYWVKLRGQEWEVARLDDRGVWRFFDGSEHYNWRLPRDSFLGQRLSPPETR